MGSKRLTDRVREFIGDIAWRVFLWSIRMTDDQYLMAIEQEVIRKWQGLQEAMKVEQKG